MTYALAYLLAFLNINVWALGHIFVRFGITNYFFPLDLVLIRYVVAMTFTLPFLKHFFSAFTRIGMLRLMTISMCMGLVYILSSFMGVYFFSASKATLIITGCMPLFSVCYGKAIEKTHFSRHIYFGILLIISSIIIIFIYEKVPIFTSPLQIMGLLVCLVASATYSFGLFLVRRLKVSNKELLPIISVPTFVLTLLLWLIVNLVRSKGTLDISRFVNPEAQNFLLLQGMFHGILISVLTVLIVAWVVNKIGNVRFSYFIAGVPLLSLLYSPIIDEEIHTARVIASIISLIGIIIANSRVPQRTP